MIWKPWIIFDSGIMNTPICTKAYSIFGQLMKHRIYRKIGVDALTRINSGFKILTNGFL